MTRETDWAVFEKAIEVTASAVRGTMGAAGSQPPTYVGDVFREVYKALKESNLVPGQWVAIPGAGGGLGHLAVQYAVAAGYRVIAIDTGDEKRKLCESLGADVWIDFKETKDIVAAVKSATGGSGRGLTPLSRSLFVLFGV